MENHLSAPYSDKMINRLGIACIVLFLISYLSHLAALPLDIKGDEGRRALVSLEMMISGDYITPTLNGELFLNKPPLYNWIMVAYLKASGSFGPFWIRLPMIMAIVLFGIFIYRYVSRYCDRMVAVVAAFAFVTNGRIIIYDSFVGLIDLTFGFCMYWLMMLVFEYGEKKKYWQLFIYTYLLTAIGYLMKGLPALALKLLRY
jgi:4-amino-4-deoxy-L-arabinose transferase-like glycosyltransferase